MSYYLLYPFLWLLSLLPWHVMYGLSSAFSMLLFYVFRYRRKVVEENLSRAFPEKSEADRKQIARQFYLHFCDVIIEVVKLVSCSHEAAKKRCLMGAADRELLRKYLEQKKNIIWVMGHTGNGDLAGASFAGIEGYKLRGLYRPLANRGINKILVRSRSRFGTVPIPVKDAYRELIKAKDDLTLTVFIADQTPPPATAYWTRFLNQDTPVYRGTEIMARKLDYVVIYGNLYKERRGKYLMKMEVLSEHPSKLPENQLTEMHTRLLERDIKAQPFNWLWSHRRWKHKPPK